MSGRAPSPGWERSRGRRARGASGPGSPSGKLVWFALFVVASVVGGLAAAAIEHESALEAAGLSLIVAAIAVFALYAGLLDGDGDGDGDGGRAGRGGPEPSATLPWRGGQPADGQAAGGLAPTTPTQAPPPPAGGPRPVPAADGVRPGAVRLMQADPAGGGWWQGRRPAQGPPAPGGQDAVAVAGGPRAVRLADFLDQALIAQCPRCGSFRLSADDQSAEWLFGCRECGQRWSWRPGSPWPAVQVRPAERRRTGRPQT